MGGKSAGELADVVLRDPYARAQECGIRPGSDLQRVLLALGIRGEKVLVANPATDPQNVIGAVVGGPCVACGGAVWLAPSSVATLKMAPAVPVVCMKCLDGKWREL